MMRSSRSHAPSDEEVDKKVDVQHAETVPTLQASESGAGSSKDAALEILGPEATPLHVTPEQDRAVLRKIDIWLMPIIFMVYFLQQLDKYVSRDAANSGFSNQHQVVAFLRFSVWSSAGCSYVQKTSYE